MDVAMLTHSISNIIQNMNFPKPLSGIDINHLENTLKNITHKLQNLNLSEQNLTWLQKVKDIVIDLNDFIEDVRHKAKTDNAASTSLIRTGFNVVNHMKATFLLKKAAEEHKRLLALLEEKVEEQESKEKKEDRRKIAYEVFKKITVFGREKEKKEIVEQLLNMNNNNSDVVVIAIVGVPGIGKTRLAHLICEDEQVKSHFDFPPIWIETFDVKSIENHVNTTTTTGKRGLLIIDDLRIEIGNDLDKLLENLTKDVRGAILVTARSNYVVNKIGARHILKLQGLNQDESSSLFKHIRGQIAASGSTESELEPKIVRDCGGVPLLIGFIAREMKKGSVGDDWTQKAVEMLEIIYYGDLPPYQKLCFAYCSLFPEDYLIDAERLIQLWTAEGFLTIPGQQYGRACLDDFVPLVFHPVVEENNDNRHCGNILYRMNPLMHKLARQVTDGSHENLTVAPTGNRDHSKTLRVSFDFALDLACGIPDSVFNTSKKLRTILLPYNSINPRLPHDLKMTTSTCDKIFNTFKSSLRVLDLHDLGVKMVPSSIEEVKHLRYLDLSHNNIEKLPGCITNLVHLQTLKLSQCHILKELPKDIEDLCCLTHLDIEGCLDLTYMPSGINKLTSLQTLSLFVASKKYVSGGLRSLTVLDNLRGHMEISHLEQVKFSPSKEASKDEFLKNKPHLEFLTLRWDHEEEDEEKSSVKDNDKDLLQCLQPHPNLKLLFIVGYNGHTLSNWLSSLNCLVKFTLSDSPKCKSLPPMDLLPLLKVIQLRRLDSLKFIVENNNVGSSTTPILFFPSLKELTISDCPNLESWWENVIEGNDRPSFSCISKLNVQYCPKLAHMPLYPGLDEELVLVESHIRPMWETMHFADNSKSTEPSKSQTPPFSKLKSMVIERIKHNPQSTWLKNFNSLEELHIRDWYRLRSLPQDYGLHLSSLQTLSIEKCEQLDLEGVTEWEGLKSLKSLTIRSIPKLKSLPRGVENVKSLQVLRLYDCHGLTSLPESIGNLTSLEKLVISECRNLDSLPKGMEKIKSLDTLIIRDCPLLLLRCQPDTGDDWPQIAHIKNKVVKDSPRD